MTSSPVFNPGPRIPGAGEMLAQRVLDVEATLFLFILQELNVRGANGGQPVNGPGFSGAHRSGSEEQDKV